jgi:hypothetical protein
MQKVKIALLVFLAIFALTSTLATPVLSTDMLVPSDFAQKSFSKTVDFLDYARTYAAANGKTPPNASSHAWLYLTYVNAKGIQMMYAGLQNITDGTRTVTLPIQSWMMHYKSQNDSKDIVTAGSFITLLAFAENSTTKYRNSPDRNDTLFASLNFGRNLTGIFGNETPPGLSTRTTIVPLTSKNNGTSWSWGMRYTNMTAIWWKTSMNTPRALPELIAVSRYDELAFNYTLALNSTLGTATLTANYVIGKITDLWIFPGYIGLILHGLLAVHYNSTGGYGFGGRYKSETLNVHQYLQSIGIKMSIVQFQSTVVLDHAVTSESKNADVANNETFVSNSSITTSTEDHERILNADFATKQTYKLYNYTQDPTETQYLTYNATTRTAKAANLADNPVFELQTFLMRYIPLVLANMDPVLYQQAKEHLLNFAYADYFYIIAYPTYGGYRIVHDPTYTAYYNSGANLTISNPPNWGGLVVIGAVIAIAAVGTTLFLKRHRRKQPQSEQPN